MLVVTVGYDLSVFSLTVNRGILQMLFIKLESMCFFPPPPVPA